MWAVATVTTMSIDRVHLISDLLRFAVGGVAGATCCTTVLVLLHYRRMRQRGHDGIFATHVLLASLSLMLHAVYIATDMFTRIGNGPWTWRLPLGALAVGTALPTLWLILSHVATRDREMEAVAKAST